MIHGRADPHAATPSLFSAIDETSDNDATAAPIDCELTSTTEIRPTTTKKV